MAHSDSAPAHTGKGGVVPPGAPDRVGKGDRAPSWAPLVVFCLIALGVCLAGLRWTHTLSAELLLVLVVLGITIALVIVSTVRLWAYVCRCDFGVLTDEERSSIEEDEKTPLADQARLILKTGALLGRPRAAQRLSSVEVSNIEANRVAEAARTAAWLDGQRDVEQVEMEAQDGIVLRAHLFHVDRTSSRWVILSHGYRGHWTEMLAYARPYAERGFNLLIPELRGHRESGGRFIGLGWLDRLDLVAWSRWVVRTQDEGARIVLHGHCMGATASCMAAGEKTLPSGVVAAVVDCAYSDAWNVARRIMAARGIPLHPTLEFARLGFLIIGGYDIAKVSAVEAVKHAQVPLLFVQGEEDPFVPPYMAKRLYDNTSGSAAGQNHRLCMFPRAGHCESVLADPRRYWHEVFAFVGKLCWQGVASPRLHRR